MPSLKSTTPIFPETSLIQNLLILAKTDRTIPGIITSYKTENHTEVYDCLKISNMKPIWSFNWVQPRRMQHECLCSYWLLQSLRNVTKETIDPGQERNVLDYQKRTKKSWCIALSLANAFLCKLILIRGTVVILLVTHSTDGVILCLLSTI